MRAVTFICAPLASFILVHEEDADICLSRKETLLPPTLTPHSHEQAWRILSLVFGCCFRVTKKIKLAPWRDEMGQERTRESSTKHKNTTDSPPFPSSFFPTCQEAVLLSRAWSANEKKDSWKKERLSPYHILLSHLLLNTHTRGTKVVDIQAFLINATYLPLKICLFRLFPSFSLCEMRPRWPYLAHWGWPRLALDWKRSRCGPKYFLPQEVSGFFSLWWSLYGFAFSYGLPYLLPLIAETNPPSTKWQWLGQVTSTLNVSRIISTAVLFLGYFTLQSQLISAYKSALKHVKWRIGPRLGHEWDNCLSTGAVMIAQYDYIHRSMGEGTM